MKKNLNEGKTFKITIVGGGKLAQSLALGISKYIPRYNNLETRINVLRVKGSLKDDKSKELSKIPRTTISSEPETILGSSIVVLAVQPTKESIDATFKKITPTLSEINTPVVSFVSGLTIDSMEKVFKREKVSYKTKGLIKATCNTNFDTANGIIYASFFQQDDKSENVLKFFKSISSVHKTTGQFVSKYTAVVGSGNAHDCEWLLRRYTESDITDSKIFSFFNNLLVASVGWEFRFQTGSQSELDSWLNAKLSGFKQIGVPHAEAILLVKETFLSSLKSFLIDLKEERGLVKRVESVVTKGGCTEKQLDVLRGSQSSHEMCVRIPKVILETFNAAKQLKVNLDDLETESYSDVKKNVFAGINKGNFPE